MFYFQKDYNACSVVRNKFQTSLISNEMIVLYGKENGWSVAVKYRKRRRFVTFCGGALVTDRHVVTAAHCLINQAITDVFVTIGDWSRYVQYAPNCLEHRKCIKMDLKCPTIELNCLHKLDYIFMVDLKSKNLHMGTHKGQNS